MAKIDMLLHGFGFNTDQGGVAYCGITLVQGSRNILVDTAHVGRRRLIIQKLAERGLTPDDIDFVFLTHAHWDHALNVDVFPKAKILIHPREREYIKDPKPTDWATPRYTSMMLEAQQLQEVQEGDELDDGVSILETPGHSRGSMALLVRDGDTVSAITGDALPDGTAAMQGLPQVVFWDVEESRASLRKLLDSAERFYPGHDRPFRLTDSGRIAYLEPTSIRAFGWPMQGEGEGVSSIGYALEPPRELNDQTGGLRSD